MEINLEQWKQMVEESKLTYLDLMEFYWAGEELTEARRNYDLLYVFHKEDYEELMEGYGHDCRSDLVKKTDNFRNTKFYQSLKI